MRNVCAVFNQCFGLSCRCSIDPVEINLNRLDLSFSKKLHSVKNTLFRIIDKSSLIFRHKTVAAVDIAGHKRKSK